MPAVDDFLFGNGALHERFRLTTQVLAMLVAGAPRSLALAQLQKSLQRSGREIVRICEGLADAGLVRPDPEQRNCWMLACQPSDVTLEDVFRMVMAGQSERPALPDPSTEPSERLLLDADLLVVQATMAVNQAIARQLRQFSLDRLRSSSAAKPPVSRQAIREALYDNEYDFEVNAWLVNTVFGDTRRKTRSK